ncbi:MAG: helix-turn-helix transcriptional regulator [Acidimicrobiales bacterium]|jgi:DNA-binding CsgD family transcriptional regulator
MTSCASYGEKVLTAENISACIQTTGGLRTIVSLNKVGPRVGCYWHVHTQRSFTRASKGDGGMPPSTQDLSQAPSGWAESELRCVTSFDTARADGLVFDGFLRLRKRSRGAIVALSERIMITNLSAAELLLPSDRELLWAQAQTALADGCRRTRDIALTCGLAAIARYKPVLAQNAMVGALVQLSIQPRTIARSVLVDPGVAGWEALTDAERTVAEVVARGLTNREAGRCICLSPHTVDSHLRQVFRKLGINSRVELARIVGEHHRPLHGAVQGVVVLEPYESPSTRSA